jgi:hypothetical protein
MRRLATARIWFAAALLLGVLGLFVVHGTAGGVLCAAAMAAFIVACFLALRGEHPEDRTAGTGMFGGGGGF